MWKLTIYQEKKYENFTTEQGVSIKHPSADFITGLIAKLTTVATETRTRYEVEYEREEQSIEV